MDEDDNTESPEMNTSLTHFHFSQTPLNFVLSIIPPSKNAFLSGISQLEAFLMRRYSFNFQNASIHQKPTPPIAFISHV